MPFCPNCRYEYDANVTECSDCEVDLVPSLPEPEDETVDPSNGYDDWVELARLTSQPSADLIIEALQSHDIPSVILSGAGPFGQTGQMGADSFSPAGGGYTLLVPEDFLQEADQQATAILGEEYEKCRLIEIDRRW